MTARALCVVAALVLAGCEEPASLVDQCVRAQIFSACLDKAKSMQSHTVTNGPSDVVNECRAASTQMAWRRAELVKPECKP